jgi:hypothetical protein
VFEGARYPLHPVGSKLLHFMLDGPEGCDATISASRFEIRYGRNASRHRYLLHPAPAVVSELFRLADAPPAASVRARIGPGMVPWPFDARWLWMDATSTTVSIRIRDATGRTGHPAVDEPLPEAITPPAPRFVDLTSPLRCPHCTRPARRYRQLRDGWLVCPACHRSFAQALE